MGNIEVLDENRLKMLFGNNSELLGEIYSIVSSDFPELSRKLEQAISEGQAESISQYAHTLKGSIANVGGLQASDTAHRINLAAKEGDLSACGELYGHFTNELETFIYELRMYADKAGV
ncbi:MAG: Hpt domain-containing protein [Spirochaetota bacterium]